MSDSLEETFCYGGKASLDLIADSWKDPQSEVPQKVGSLRLLEEFQERVREMPYSERVSWAVGGLVLTAGLLFVRWETLIPQLFCSHICIMALLISENTSRVQCILCSYKAKRAVLMSSHSLLYYRLCLMGKSTLV